MKTHPNAGARNSINHAWYKSTIAICACLLQTISLRAELPSTITTTDGQTYNGVSLVRVEPDGYLVNYKPRDNGLGMAKIKFSRLTADQQKQAGYEPDKAREFEAKVAKAAEDWRQESVRLEQAAKTELQARQARDAQDEQLAIQRIAAVAELKMAEANLAARNADSGYGWSSGGGAVAIPEIGYDNQRNLRTSYTSPLNRIPITEVRPAYVTGKPIPSPFTPSR